MKRYAKGTTLNSLEKKVIDAPGKQQRGAALERTREDARGNRGAARSHPRRIRHACHAPETNPEGRAEALRVKKQIGSGHARARTAPTEKQAARVKKYKSKIRNSLRSIRVINFYLVDKNLKKQRASCRSSR